MSVYQTSSRDRVTYLDDGQPPDYVAHDTFRRWVGTKILAYEQCVKDEVTFAVAVE